MERKPTIPKAEMADPILEERKSYEEFCAGIKNNIYGIVQMAQAERWADEIDRYRPLVLDYRYPEHKEQIEE